MIGWNYYNIVPKIDFCIKYCFDGNNHNYNSLYRINQRTQSQKNDCTNATYSFSHLKKKETFLYSSYKQSYIGILTILNLFTLSFIWFLFILSCFFFFLYCPSVTSCDKDKGISKNSTASVPTLRKHTFWWWIRYIHLDSIKKQINKNNALTRNGILGVRDNIW